MGSDTRELFLICSKVYLFNFVKNAVIPGSESCIFSNPFKSLCSIMALPIPIFPLFLRNIEAPGVSRNRQGTRGMNSSFGSGTARREQANSPPFWRVCLTERSHEGDTKPGEVGAAADRKAASLWVRILEKQHLNRWDLHCKRVGLLNQGRHRVFFFWPMCERKLWKQRGKRKRS